MPCQSKPISPTQLQNLKLLCPPPFFNFTSLLLILSPPRFTTAAALVQLCRHRYCRFQLTSNSVSAEFPLLLSTDVVAASFSLLLPTPSRRPRWRWLLSPSPSPTLTYSPPISFRFSATTGIAPLPYLNRQINPRPAFFNQLGIAVVGKLLG